MRQKEILLLVILMVLIAGFFPACGAEEIPDPYSAPDISGVIGTIPPLFDNPVTASNLQYVSIPEPENEMTSIPLIFIENNGQNDDNVLFEVVSDGGIISFTRNGSIIRVVRYNDDDEAIVSTIDFIYKGSSDVTLVEGIDPFPCWINFMKGSNPSEWVVGATTFGSIRYRDLYPGIDLLYSGTSDGLKSSFIVKPGAHPSDISMQFSGHESVALSTEGDLIITTDAGPLTQSAPYCYQEINGERIEIKCNYVALGQDRYGFILGDYDTEKDLVIDPVIQFSLYLRGIGFSDANGVAVDPAGNTYIVGTSLPLVHTINGSPSTETDVVIAKINPDGTLPVFVSYIGGNGNETGTGIAIDPEGYSYITGTTNSPDFTLKNPIQGFLAGQDDAFVTKLHSNGSLVYSTYIGGTGSDSGNAIAIDTLKNTYITGSTNSKIFPVNHGSTHTSLAGNFDAFIVKISENGTNLLYSEYIGGILNDVGYGIALDKAGNTYITGETFSKNFPVVNASQPVFGGFCDAFITKLAADGYTRVYSTYLGGSQRETGRAIAVDAGGYAHVTGVTFSKNFPVKSAFKPTYSGTASSFYTRLEPEGNALSLSTYLTYPGYNEGRGIAVDSSGNAYLTGVTEAPKLQTINAFQPTYGGGTSDAFVAKFIRGENAPLYLSYLGGNGKDEGHAIAIDGTCGVYIVGLTRSTNFPTSSPYPSPFLPKLDGGFITKILEEGCPPCPSPVANFTFIAPNCTEVLTVTFTDTSLQDPTNWTWQFGDGATSAERNPTHTYSGSGTYLVNLTATKICGDSPIRQSTVTKPVTVVSERAPIANFTLEPQSGLAPLEVQFNDTSLFNPVAWSWEFGDGSISSLRNPEHTYTSAGTYSVNLTVTNRCGNDSVTRLVSVDVCPSPGANFTYLTNECNTTVTFTDTSTEDATNWSWQFGDGTTSSIQNPVHTYSAAGTYVVNLTVQKVCSDGTPRQSSVSKTVNVSPISAPVANFTYKQSSGCANFNVQFTDTSTNNPVNWSWDFGDGATSSMQNPSHTYTTTGTFNVTLIVCNNCGCDSKVRTVTVLGPCPTTCPTICPTTCPTGCPTPYPTICPTNCPTTVPTTIPTTIITTPPTTIVTTLPTTTIPTTEPTTKPTTCPTTEPTTIPTTGPTTEPTTCPTTEPTTIPTTEPTTEPTTLPTCTTIPTTTIPTTCVTIVPTTEPTNGGGGGGTVPPLPHAFYGEITINGDPAGAGTVVTAVATGGGGSLTMDTAGIYGSATFSDKLIVQGLIAEGAPIAFYADGARAECYDVVTDGPWMLTYPFESGEVTELNLRVEEIPADEPPVADFAANRTTGPSPLPVSFIDTSTNAPITWQWDFGDGNSSDLKNPVHTYLSPGEYTVSLNVTNAAGSGFEAKEGYITVTGTGVTPPVADFEVNITEGIPPLAVGFTDLSAHTPTSWEWNYGDGYSSTEQNPVHSYTAVGNYTVILTVTNAGGSNTTIKEDLITVYPITGADTGYFLIHSNVDGADVLFDEDLKGSTSEGSLLVPVNLALPSYMNYTVAKDGYYPVTAHLPAYPLKDHTVEINVILEPVSTGSQVFYITAIAMKGGKITPSGLVAVNAGQSRMFDILPFSNYAIYNILIDNQSRGPLNNYTFTDVVSNHTLTAYFSAIGGGSGGGGGGGGGGGSSSSSSITTSPTTIPTTVPTNGIVTGESGITTTEGGNITVTVEPTEPSLIITTDATPPTTVPPAQPFWSKFPMAWLIPIIIVIVLLAALAYYNYRKEQGEGLFEEK